MDEDSLKAGLLRAQGATVDRSLVRIPKRRTTAL